jgi:hypothetical protein
MRAAIDRHNSKKQETNELAKVEKEGDDRPVILDYVDSEADDDFIPKSLANFIKEIDQNLEASKREFGIDTVNTMDITLRKEINGPKCVSPCRTIPLWDPSDESSSKYTLSRGSLQSKSSSTSMCENSTSGPAKTSYEFTEFKDFRESKIPLPKIYCRDVLRDLANHEATKEHNDIDANNTSLAAKKLESPSNYSFVLSQFSNMPTPKAGTASSCTVDFPGNSTSDDFDPRPCKKDENALLNISNVEEKIPCKQDRLQFYVNRSKKTSSHAVASPNLKKVRVTINQRSNPTKRFSKLGISNDRSHAFIAKEFQKIDCDIARLRLLLRSTPEEAYKVSAPQDNKPSVSLGSLLECLEIECDEEKSKGDTTSGDVIEDESISDFFSGMKDMFDRGVHCICRNKIQNGPNRTLSPVYEKERSYSSPADINCIINVLQRQQKETRQVCRAGSLDQDSLLYGYGDIEFFQKTHEIESFVSRKKTSSIQL